jgi:hypothetical protein
MVETSWPVHNSRKSRFRKTAHIDGGGPAGGGGAPASAEPGTVSAEAGGDSAALVGALEAALAAV